MYGSTIARVRTRSLLPCPLGINICQNFNISPEDLLYKWEAFSFSATRTGPVIFNLDQALALKRQIQRDMAAETKKAQQAAQARPHLANFGRGRGSRPSGLERMAFGKASPTPASTRSSNLAGDDRPRTNFAGPSKVAYNGPKQDEASRKKRNCERVPFETYNMFTFARQIYVREGVGAQ